MNAKDIIKESSRFRASYGNPSTGVPKTQDFNWYVLGRVDQLHKKIDTNFNLILEKIDEHCERYDEKLSKNVSKTTFWKMTGFLVTLIAALIGIVLTVR